MAFQSNNYNRNKNHKNIHTFLTELLAVSHGVFCSIQINFIVPLSSIYEFLAAEHFSDTASKHFTKMFYLVKIKCLVLNYIKSKHMYVHYLHPKKIIKYLIFVTCTVWIHVYKLEYFFLFSLDACCYTTATCKSVELWETTCNNANKMATFAL